MKQLKKSDFIASFLAIVFAISTTVSANTCTDAVFKEIAYYYMIENSGLQLDSVDSPNFSHQTYTYSNGKVSSSQVFEKESGTTTTLNYYWNKDESALTKQGIEYFMKDSTSGDTTFIFENYYVLGVMGHQKTIKLTSQSASILTKDLDFGQENFEEIINKGDTVIINRYSGKDNSTALSNTEFYVSDTENTKCLEMDKNGTIANTINYEPMNDGYSLSFYSDGFITIHYYSKPEGTTSIRKTVKRIKIAPKAHYFDLLGRYKFAK